MLKETSQKLNQPGNDDSEKLIGDCSTMLFDNLKTFNTVKSSSKINNDLSSKLSIGNSG